MDDLRSLIRTFNNEDKRSFRQYLLRKRMPKNRKDLDLFLLCTEEKERSKNELFEALYPDTTDKNPYHSLRKRLFKNLHDFLYLKEIDNSLQANQNKSLTLLHHYFKHQLKNLAWKELRKMEIQANREENYHSLKKLYSLALENYDSDLAHKTLDEFLVLRKSAAVYVADEENLKIIASVVRQELKQIIRSGKDADLMKLTERLLKRFDLSERVLEHHRLQYIFVELMRDATLSQKRYFEFEPFVMAHLRIMEDAGYLAAKPYHGLSIYYMAAHTLYRNKKFTESLKYLARMEALFDEKRKGAFQQFYSKFIMLKSACMNYTGELDEAINALVELKKSKWLDNTSEINSTLNLAIYYFQKGEFKEANQTLLGLDHTDMWYEKIMGIEWRLKKNMVEVFFQYELENFDIAYDRIVSIERIFKSLLKTEKYARVGTFLKLIKQIIQKPDLIGSEAFIEKIENSFEWRAFREEDLQAMGYYAWLKSKNVQKSYYSTQLALLGSDESQS
ncbi:MAG: hypothetical protein MK078_00285 [Crocinitomicaceae bacterium]|nr:hypothetical protein [Crocinitomicaceae bacterium]